MANYKLISLLPMPLCPTLCLSFCTCMHMQTPKHVYEKASCINSICLLMKIVKERQGQQRGFHADSSIFTSFKSKPASYRLRKLKNLIRRKVYIQSFGMSLARRYRTVLIQWSLLKVLVQFLLVEHPRRSEKGCCKNQKSY